ncbi:PadR family transcriptional regulator [Fredinandcohnia sp. 179-A 10B2 NHS]|uniref:PadR family transcriptional regulator n=1 Tax=Fredinandcohnia sp. 179-A 10B2 NHS TaxID=3235176 RepID=UPI00399EEE44
MKRRRGFVQIAILHLLEEDFMHGYQIMKELEERSNGAYSASAGTVYPALQELADQNLIDVDDKSGKKVYSINDIGKKRLEEVAKHKDGDFWNEWKERMIWKNSAESIQLTVAMERWEKEVRKSMKLARKNPGSVIELITLIDEMTERLQKKNNT